MSEMASPARTRLRREDRRRQLLDAAASLVVERGAAAVTMERLAEWAGVSKALPYAHFDNSDHVLIALYQRVARRLGTRVLQSLEAAGPDDDKAAIVVATYLDAVREMGAVLAAVSAPGSRVADLADGDARRGPRFVADLLVGHFAVPRERAEAAAPILLGALTGAVASWRDGKGSRRRVEALAVDVLRAVVAES